MKDIAALKEQIESLELHHMEIPIDQEKLLLDDYPEAHVHLSVAITQGFFRRIKEDLPSHDHKFLERALAHAKWFAINRLASEMHDLIDRSVLFMLTEAENTGWYRKEEWLGYQDLSELLSSTFEQTEEETSSWYDWKFIVEQLVPAADKFGISPGDIMSASYQVKKLRGMVTTARSLLSKHEANRIDTKDAEAGLAWMLDLVKDPQVSYSSMKDRLNRYEGKIIAGRPEPINAHKFMTPDNKIYYTIEVTDRVTERMIEQALKNRVTFTLTSLGDLFDKVGGMIKSNRKEDDINGEKDSNRNNLDL